MSGSSSTWRVGTMLHWAICWMVPAQASTGWIHEHRVHSTWSTCLAREPRKTVRLVRDRYKEASKLWAETSNLQWLLRCDLRSRYPCSTFQHLTARRLSPGRI